MADAEKIARAFIETWERKDPDEIADSCTEDMVYQNMPSPPMHGREAIRAFMKVNMPKCQSFTSEILSIATSADGKRVLQERVDTLVFNGKSVTIGVMGLIEIRGGKISAWRDYFDTASYTRAMRAAGVNPGPGIAD